MAGTVLGKIDTTATQATYATGSLTPVSGKTVLVTVSNRKAAGTADTPTLAGTNGFNVTWTQIQTVLTGSSNLSRVTKFRGVPSSGTAGTLTASFGGTSQAQGSIIAVSYDAIDQTTDQGVVQSNVASGATGGALSVNVPSSAFTVGNYGTLSGVARGTPTSFTPDASPAMDGSDSVTGGLNGTAVEWFIDPDGNASLQGTLVSGSNWAAILVELAVEAAAVGQPSAKRMGAVPGGRQIAPAGGGSIW